MTECKFDDRKRQAAGRGWCKMHWTRWRKYGDPSIVMPYRAPNKIGGNCTIEGCNHPYHARGYCNMHYTRFYKHGDPNVVGESAGRPLKGDVPTFAAIHKRLARKYGPAKRRVCVDCGSEAREWSYNGCDPQEVHGAAGDFIIPYSLDITNYEPRCVSCHRKFDGAGVNRKRNENGQFMPEPHNKRYADDKPYVRITVRSAV